MAPKVRASVASTATSHWSKELQCETCKAIADAPVTADGCLHFEHPTQGFSYVKVEELCHSRLLMFCKPNGEKLWFDDVDALLQAGWAID
jgi:hypothetical protein